MHPYLIDLLQCPTCHQALFWEITDQHDGRINHAVATCSGCKAAYPIRDGIGVFLIPRHQRKDLWQEVDSALTEHLRQHSDLERQLMSAPLESLSPTDQQFRAMILEEYGRYAEAQIAEDVAKKNLYTNEYLNCWNSQIEFVLKETVRCEGPIIDLASGRCYLVEMLARHSDHPLVASDFSLQVLRRNRQVLEFQGHYERISLLAFDARSTPFKDNAVTCLVSNLGLPNIQAAGTMLQELKRVVSGTFLAISHFYPVDDPINRQAITELGLEELLYKTTTLERFSQAGWQASAENPCLSRALPTPPSRLFEGARADGLPVAETTLEWCTLKAI